MEKVHSVEPRQYPTSFGIGGGEGDLSADHTKTNVNGASFFQGQFVHIELC